MANVNGPSAVEVHFGELNAAQRAQVMQRARLNASRNAPTTEISAATRILAIASGKGGVGKSSVTANIAAALADLGFTVGVLDADIWGFSIPRMLGVDGRLGGTGGMIEPATRPIGTRGGMLKVVSMGLLVDDEDKAIMWRGLLLAKAVEEFLVKVRWGDLDYLVIDMPPGTGDVQMALGRLLPRSELLIVTTPALAAQKVAVRVADMARRGYLRVAGVIENMSWFEDGRGERHAVFGTGGGERLSADLGVPFVAQLPLDPRVAAGGDIGEPSGPRPGGGHVGCRHRVPRTRGTHRRRDRPADRDAGVHRPPPRRPRGCGFSGRVTQPPRLSGRVRAPGRCTPRRHPPFVARETKSYPLARAPCGVGTRNLSPGPRWLTSSAHGWPATRGSLKTPAPSRTRRR